MSETTLIQSSVSACNQCDDAEITNGYQHMKKDLQQQSFHQIRILDSTTTQSVRNSCPREKSSTRYLDELETSLLTNRRPSDEKDVKNLLDSFSNCPLSSDDLEERPTKQPHDWDQFYSFPRIFLNDNNTSSKGTTQPEPFILQPSLFHRNNFPPTVYFKTKLTEETKPPVPLPKSLQPFFKWKISAITPNTIRNCILFMKFETIKPSNLSDNHYLGSWCKHMPTADFGQLEEWRKVNHYPGSFHMGRKDKLWLRLKLANQKHASFETFHPMTFVLPRDYDELCIYWKKSPSKLFIVKPPASARGNGVKVINDISFIPESLLKLPESTNGNTTKKSTIIVQQYISNPCLLENGQKFDLRIYVLITSVDPLRIYVYEDGLVRFASSKYSSQEDGIINQYMHLTNYFVNKNNQEYKINNDCESLQGCKWTLKRFWRYLEEHHKHIDTKRLWSEIIDIIIKTIISCEAPMARLSHQNCKNDYTSYELFGFDILLDENYKPWILEVNITPSLKSESNLDTSVKFRVIRDMFNLVGYHLPPPESIGDGRYGHLHQYNLHFDPRLYTEILSKSDKAKHVKFQKMFKTKCDAKRYKQQQCSTNISSTKSQSESLSATSQFSSQVVLSSGNVENASLLYTRGNELELGTVGCSEHHSNDRSIDDDSILSDLTQQDVRVLVLAEDELSRRGRFDRVFPSATSSRYLEYFDKPRYYNLLLDAWEQNYQGNRAEGIQRLSRLATFLDRPCPAYQGSSESNKLHVHSTLRWS